jgi:N-methylhydantoinase A
VFRALEREARRELKAAEITRFADIRYVGQSYELAVPWNKDDPGAPFHREHQRTYGYSNPERQVEVVTVRIRARIPVEKPKLRAAKRASAEEKTDTRRIFISRKWRQTPVYERGQIGRTPVKGPALVVDYGSTTLVPAGWNFAVDRINSLVMRVSE